jgi:hypothetical protein
VYNANLQKNKSDEVINRLKQTQIDLNRLKQTSESTICMYDEKNNIYECEYCSQNYKYSKYLHNHQIKSCIKIPDKIKNRLIIKHNNNSRTKTKLPLIISTNNNSKIYNINNNISGNTINTSTVDNSVNTNNEITNNEITNNTLTSIKLNSFGNETLDHISDEKMNEIVKGDIELMHLLCQELSKIPANNNAFIDTRKNLAFYLDSNDRIKIERIKQYIFNFCNIYMERMKQYIFDNPDKFTQIAKNVFKDTYDIYFCIINRHNFDDMESIEKEHENLVKKFIDDVKINLINTNKVSKNYLDSIEKDFYKLT